MKPSVRVPVLMVTVGTPVEVNALNMLLHVV